MPRIDFVIAGAQKAGTTALRHYLRRHPDIELPVQECHVFDKPEKQPDPALLSSKKKLRGDCTPSYMYLPNSAKRIRLHNDQMKIICLLRNPVDRAYSHFWMNKRRGSEDCETFRQATDREIERHRMSKGRTVMHSYLDRGFYSEQIRRLVRHFPKEQILVGTQENLLRNPKYTIKEICEFLGVKSISVEHGLFHKQDYPPMGQDDRRELEEFFRGEIISVQILTGLNLEEWLE